MPAPDSQEIPHVRPNTLQTPAALAFFESTPLGIATGKLIAGKSLQLDYANPAFTHITGFTINEVQGGSLESLLLRAAAPALLQQIFRQLLSGNSFTDTLRCLRADGSIFWGRLTLAPTKSNEKAHAGWTLSLENVETEHQRMLELRQEEEQYRLLASNSRDMIVMLRFDGTCSYVSPALESMLGRSNSFLLNQPLDKIFHPEDSELLKQVIQRHRQKQSENIFTHRLVHADGTYLWCETTTRTVWGLEGKQPGSLIAITRDISKRRSAERELQEMHQLLSSVFDSVPLGLCITSSTGRIIQANLGFASPLGFTPAELCGRIVENLIPLTLLRPGAHDGNCQRVTGETFPVHISVTVLSEGMGGNTLITLSDQTERQIIQSRLREAERLESLGTLAGGVAHDFNNLLAIILGYSGLLGQAAPENEAVAEYADTITEAGRRGADVVRQLMLYANQHEPLLAETDLHALLANVLVHTAEGWPEQVAIDCDYLASNPIITIDAEQIARAVEHLLRNAREAITNKGTICLRTAERPSDPNDRCGSSGWTEISIIDDGRGMDEATRARMFEPFFSRNKSPEVRGLGLAIVYGIVQAHNGRVEVESAPGRGTRITLLLPRRNAMGSKYPNNPYQEKEYKLRSGATMLMIEDEHDIGRLWQELLSREGWTVHWAKDGAQALALFELHKESIQIVFSDIGLPGELNGWEIAAIIRSARPELPILLASGFFQRGSANHASISEPVSFIDKPYQVPDVVARLHQLLAHS